MLTLRIPLAASHRKPFSRGLNKLWFIFLVASESCCGTRYPLNSGHYLGTPAGLPEARTYNSSRAFSKFPEGHSTLEGDEKCVFCMGSLVPQHEAQSLADNKHTTEREKKQRGIQEGIFACSPHILSLITYSATSKV